jgi:hypothetical protein
MAKSVSVTLTGNTLAGLFFIQRYRFLTITQFARVTGFYYSTAADTLRQFERAGILGFFRKREACGEREDSQSVLPHPQGMGNVT